jgi:hypothetical protein
VKKHWLLFFLVFLFGCQRKSGKTNDTLFKLVNPKYSGFNFSGQTATHKSKSRSVKYGVALGDINNDGLPEIIMSDMSGVRLYLNEGKMKFTDITAKAGLIIPHANMWNCKAFLVDINGDGLLDIYVTTWGVAFKDESREIYDSTVGRNYLFINNGNLTFTEKAKEYNLDMIGYTSVANFFDYDNDGDLDLFVSSWPYDNHGDEVLDKIFSFDFFNSEARYKYGANRLYENVNGKFIDVSEKAGISKMNSCAHAVITADINHDGWVDIYSGSDFLGPDRLYMNNGNKTFTEVSNKYFTKTPLASMGADIADVDGDGWQELFVAEMFPIDKKRQKLNVLPLSLDFFNTFEAYHQAQQLQRNMFYKNNHGENFSEIGYLTNTAATDWSWATLFADFDNNGTKDLYVASGPWVNWINVDRIKGIYGKDFFDKNLEKLDITGKYKVHNKPTTETHDYVFKNEGNLKFTDVSSEWGLSQKSGSYGAAYADLDGDGDLDIVVNNGENTASIYENKANELYPLHNYLRVQLHGSGMNSKGLGGKVYVYCGKNLQMQEITSVRGFISCSEFVAHFGLDTVKLVDSVRVEWLGEKVQMLYNVKANQLITVNENEAHLAGKLPGVAKEMVFKDITQAVGVNYMHKESAFSDFKRDRMLHRKFSREGPALAVADVNGDGLEDFYVGGALGQAGALYVQTPQGFKLSPVQDMYNFPKSEQAGALFFDANGDGFPDLLITGASNEFKYGDSALLNRLFINDGKGHFTYDRNALPDIYSATEAAAATNFDKDGGQYLFIGGRISPGLYPLPPRSYLLENRNGKFVDVTNQKAKGLDSIGMVTSAIWSDYDNDGDMDLIVVGDWMPVTIFRNDNGVLHNVTKELHLDSTTGWWNCVKAVDINNDGYTDYVLGNLGLNSVFRASTQEPMTMLANDFDKNGSIDPVLFHYISGINSPFVNRDIFCEQMPYYNNVYYNYESYANATYENMFTEQQKVSSYKLEAKMMESIILMNDSGKGFHVIKLPTEAQVSPVNDIVFTDIDHDGKPDMIIAGNSNCAYYNQGDDDAMKGLVLLNRGNGKYVPSQFYETGFYAPGFARKLGLIYHKGLKKSLLIVGNNNAALQVFQLK